MKLLVTGGAGDMGRVACATTAADEVITEVVVADRDGPRAAEVAAEIGSKATPMTLDITDADALREAASSADMILNTVGPFYAYGRSVLEAAIDAGVHYADINDDWEPTVEMLELSDQAASADITALVGIGASPGITNLLAVVALRDFETIDRVFIGWRTGTGVPKVTSQNPRPEASAAIDHWVHNCADRIRIWRGGRHMDADAMEELTVTYPGAGSGSVWTVGHPEPITLPITYPGMSECLNVMVSRPGLIEAMRRVVKRVQSGELDVHQGANALLLEPNRRGPAAGEPAPFPDMFALVEGTVDGQPTRVGVDTNVVPQGGMGEITAIPLSIAAGMLARGEITKRGVAAAEAAIDPDVFFSRLAPYSAPPIPEDHLTIVREAIDA